MGNFYSRYDLDLAHDADLRDLQATLAEFDGRWVTWVQGSCKIEGTLQVGVFMQQDEAGVDLQRYGFTVNVTGNGASPDFVALGVWSDDKDRQRDGGSLLIPR